MKSKQFDHSIFRLVIRNIEGYGTHDTPTHGTLRSISSVPSLDVLKHKVLQHLLQKQSKRKSRLVNWSIAWQTHASSGLPHLDILLVYQRNVSANYTTFDYIIKDLGIAQRDVGDDVGVGHVWVTPYSSKKLNKAILDYGEKEDPSPLSNFTLQVKQQLVRLHKLKADVYLYLQQQMLKDPLHFNLEQYVRTHNLDPHIPNWSGIKTKLKDMQAAAANLSLKNKPGFRLITDDLINSKLNNAQKQLYYGVWDGYRRIVSYLNQIVSHKGNRDPKTLNLLITGAPNTGKSALVWHPNPHDEFNPISAYCSVYPIGMSQWFPKYQSDVYHCIYWNEAKLTSYSYDTILKLLDGSPLDLPNKGAVSRKVDNPLIIMTSNLSLEQMIQQKFGHNKQYIKMARKNLAVRVQNVIVPKKYNLFLLQKLLIP